PDGHHSRWPFCAGQLALGFPLALASPRYAARRSLLVEEAPATDLQDVVQERDPKVWTERCSKRFLELIDTNRRPKTGQSQPLQRVRARNSIFVGLADHSRAHHYGYMFSTCLRREIDRSNASCC